MHKALLRVGTPVQAGVFLIHQEAVHEAKVREIAGFLRPLLKPKEDDIRLAVVLRQRSVQ